MIDHKERSSGVRIHSRIMDTKRLYFHSIGILIVYAVLFMVMRQALFAQLVTAVENEPEIDREGVRVSSSKLPFLIRHTVTQQAKIEKAKTPSNTPKTVVEAEIVTGDKATGDKDTGPKDTLRYVRHVLQSFLHA